MQSDFGNLLCSGKPLSQKGHNNTYEVNARCENCLSIVGRGQPHQCSASTRAKNVETLISQSPLKLQNQIISSTLKKKVFKGANSSQTSFAINQFHGKPLKIAVNPKKSKENPVIKSSDWKKVRTKFGLTNNTTLGIASMVRVATNNRKIIEPNLKQNLSDEIHSLDSFFVVKSFNFKSTKKMKLLIYNYQPFIAII